MPTQELPIYLISMEKDEGRRKELASRFPKNFPKMTHIPAVDGRQLRAQEFFSCILKPVSEGRRLMLPGEVGCSLSHVTALESFVHSGKHAALILEDDVIGNDESIESLQELIPLLPEHSLTICGGQEGMPAAKYVLGKAVTAPELFQVARFSQQYLFRTCCYVVTQKSAQQILKVQSESLRLADAWGSFFRNTDIEILYTQKFSHPKELQKSHLEQERALFGHKSEFGNRDMIPRLKRRFERIRRKINKVIFLLKGYQKVVK